MNEYTEESYKVLLTALMRKIGDRVELTHAEIADARQAIQDGEVQMVWYETDRTGANLVAVEFRHRSRRVLEGEVV